MEVLWGLRAESVAEEELWAKRQITKRASIKHGFGRADAHKLRTTTTTTTASTAPEFLCAHYVLPHRLHGGTRCSRGVIYCSICDDRAIKYSIRDGPPLNLTASANAFQQ